MPDWIEWHGGERPVPADALVDARLRDGMTLPALPAAGLSWGLHGDPSYDIVAYRVVGTVGQPDTQDDYEQTEADPTGRDPHQAGAKLDGGKHEPELILRGFARALTQISFVGTYGARKYTRDGWEEVPDGVRRYTNAMYRHLLAESCGEKHDPDTGISHAAHAAWNALARLELMLRESTANVSR